MVARRWQLGATLVAKILFTSLPGLSSETTATSICSPCGRPSICSRPTRPGLLNVIVSLPPSLLRSKRKPIHRISTRRTRNDHERISLDSRLGPPPLKHQPPPYPPSPA